MLVSRDPIDDPTDDLVEILIPSDTLPALSQNLTKSIIGRFLSLLTFPMNPAITLPEIRSNCSPRPLEGNGLREFFVETSEARDDLGNLRANLRNLFEETGSFRHVLVYGHRGCGKSTELNKFREELGDSWFVVRFSIFDLLPSVGIQAEDILLAMAVAIFGAAGAEGGKLKVSDKHLAQVHCFFSQVTKSELSTKDADLKISGGGGVKEKSLWSQLLGL